MLGHHSQRSGSAKTAKTLNQDFYSINDRCCVLLPISVYLQQAELALVSKSKIVVIMLYLSELI